MEWAVLEGNHQKLDGGSMFGHVPKILWEKWVKTDDKNRASLACRTLLFKVNNQHILFEAGVGAFFSPKMRERYGLEDQEHLLIKDLKKQGLDPDQIDHIILSHLHFDHAGGLLKPFEDHQPLSLIFNKANFWITKNAFERAKNPHTRDKASFIPGLIELLENSGRLRFVENKGVFAFDPSFSYRESNGHTPGLLIMTVQTPKGPIYLPSDLIPGIPWIHLPVTSSFDRYPELAINEKKYLLDEVIEKNGTLFLTHDKEFPFARVEKEGDRYSGKGLKSF